jgi:hypothetical protein
VVLREVLIAWFLFLFALPGGAVERGQEFSLGHSFARETEMDLSQDCGRHRAELQRQAQIECGSTAPLWVGFWNCTPVAEVTEPNLEQEPMVWELVGRFRCSGEFVSN